MAGFSLLAKTKGPGGETMTRPLFFQVPATQPTTSDVTSQVCQAGVLSSVIEVSAKAEVPCSTPLASAQSPFSLRQGRSAARL